MNITLLIAGIIGTLPFVILIIASILAHFPSYFHSHLNSTRYNFKDITPEHEVFMDYEKWFTLYNGDPKHWDLSNLYFPVYSLNAEEWYVTRFRKKRDFKKWQKFVKTSKEKGEDYENLQDLEKLTALVKAENEKTIQQRREELNKLYSEYEANLLAATNRTKEEVERKEQMQIGSH